jgi:tetratricopeptide (TPR) repeat protein
VALTIGKMSARRYAFVLAAIALVAHWPATWGEFIWDDDQYVQNNPTLRTPEGLTRIWGEPGATPQYYPLVFTTFWLEYRFWGDQPAGYHIVNLLLHAANAMLFWLVLRRLNIPGAWLAAALFAVHPVHVESVAWITERKNVLSGVFYWAAFLAYLRFALAPAAPETTQGGWRWYALAVVLYTCALLTKTVTCSLPAVLLLVLWWKDGRITLRNALALAPMLVLGAALALVTIWMERDKVGAHGPDFDLSIVERFLIAGRAVWFYVAKLVWPVELSFSYPRWHIDDTAAWQYAFPAAALAVVLALWLIRRRLGVGPLVAWLCFVGTLLPALGFITVYPMLYSFVADHFQYLASAAILTLAAAAAVRLWPQQTEQMRKAGVAVACAVVAILGVLTWRQAMVYRDLETLWTDTLAKNPESWLAQYNLGQVYREKGTQQRQPELIEAALRSYERALHLRPNLADAHNQRGVALVLLNRLSEAIPEFERALRNPAQTDPSRALVHTNLGSALCAVGRIDEGVEHFRTALRLLPDYAPAHDNLGRTLSMRGQHKEAIEHLTRVLRADPANHIAAYALGKSLVAESRVTEAVQMLKRAVEGAPGEPSYRFSLAEALRRAGQYDEANRHHAEGLRLQGLLRQ